MNWLKRKTLDVPLVLTAILSAFLNSYGIWKETTANAYYTAAVASMLQSFHNFFFASFDPGGFVTVDKPPVVFWIQAAFAYVFGVHGWSVILPQALAGVGSVLLIYKLVKPSFGTGAARLAALTLALTPIAAAVSRTNNIDSMLVFTLLLGAVLLFRGLRRGGIWAVMGGFALIGVGFNMKMLQAYMVLPAFYLVYWLAYNRDWKKKLGGLAAATSVLLVFSLSWPVVVDSIPVGQRPYVGSSQTNSVLELAFGYNGVSRLTGNRGQNGGGAARGDGGAATAPQQMNGDRQPPAGGGQGTNGRDGGGQGFQDGGQGTPGGMGGGGSFGTGTKGPLRLIQTELAGQASWMLPLAFVGAFGILASLRRRNFTMKHKEVLFWLAWLIPGLVFFSIAGFFHHYYLIMLAPPIAALTGAGFMELWRRYKSSSNWTACLLPVAVAGTTALQWYILHPFDDKIGSMWSSGIAAGGLVFTLLLVMQKLLKQKLPGAIAIASVLVLLVAPFYWSATPITYGQNTQLPQAGPGTANNSFGGRPDDGGSRPGGGNNEILNAGLYTYLKAHNTGEKFLFATSRYSTAVPYILEKGEAVMAMGGYSGSDPILTVESLQVLVKKGEVKYFLIAGGGMGGGGSTNSALTQWIVRNGKQIDASDYSSTANSGTLYEVTLSQ